MMTMEIDEGSDESEHEESQKSDESVVIELPWIVGDWVKVVYDEQVFPGEVISIIGSNSQVNCMSPVGKNWRWPDAPDILWYSQEKVLGKINPVVPMGGSREYYSCSEL